MTPPCSTQLTGQPVKKGERVAGAVVQVADSPDTAVLVARISSTRRLVGPSDAGPNAYTSSAKPTVRCTAPANQGRKKSKPPAIPHSKQKAVCRGQDAVAGSIESLRLERAVHKQKWVKCGKRSNPVPPPR
jgi:hypothetical protein